MRQSGFRLLVIFLAAVPMAPAWAAGVEAYCAELQWVLLAPDGGGTVQVIDVRRGVTPLATLRSRQRGRPRHRPDRTGSASGLPACRGAP